MSDASLRTREIFETLRAAVKKRPETRDRIARLAQMDPTALSRFMRDERGFTLDTVVRLARVLDLEVTVSPLPARAQLESA